MKGNRKSGQGQGRIGKNAMWMFAATLVLMAACPAWGQEPNLAGPPAVDVLGAHDNAGRGCASCHVQHVSLDEDRAEAELWGARGTPEYGDGVSFLTQNGVVKVGALEAETGDAEVGGVILCVSCHDGNVTPQNMMASRSYAQRLGLQAFVPGVPRPTMLGDELAAQFTIDHPLGQGTNIVAGDGLEFVNGKFLVRPDTPYARFVKSYGWPSLAPLERSNPFGVDREGQPYVVCTTCHNQHAMNVYASGPNDPIAGNTSGQSYTTFFFVNGPYNPTINATANYSASSSMQFCRQCHFNLSNEGNNSPTPTTFF